MTYLVIRRAGRKAEPVPIGESLTVAAEFLLRSR
jgi:hypothetical protein